jgi:glucose-1-phosphatase
MPPKFIYFDMGNVLFHFSHERQAAQIAGVAGVNAADVYSLLYRDQQGLHWSAERGEISPAEFYARFCHATRSQPDRAAFDSASNDIFWPNTSIVPLVSQLRCAGHRLGVLSNTSQAHWEFCRARFRILEVFPLYALSFEIRAMKPDERIYAAAASLAGARPDEIFFTDDRPDNVACAQRAGWDAVLFESADQLAGELRRRGARTNY